MSREALLTLLLSVPVGVATFYLTTYLESYRLARREMSITASKLRRRDHFIKMYRYSKNPHLLVLYILENLALLVGFVACSSAFIFLAIMALWREFSPKSFLAPAFSLVILLVLPTTAILVIHVSSTISKFRQFDRWAKQIDPDERTEFTLLAEHST